jgi:hypothetical protein
LFSSPVMSELVWQERGCNIPGSLHSLPIGLGCSVTKKGWKWLNLPPTGSRGKLWGKKRKGQSMLEY